MAEGKTLVPSAPCDLCEGDDSVNFCINCQQDLCVRCSTAHRKIPDLSHHKLRPITDRRASGTNQPSPQAYCKDHPSKPVSVICEECLKALCATCADAEHRNHKLLRTNINAELLHRICVQKVPEFLDLLQILDKEKDGSPLKLQLYKQARDMVKIWRDQLSKIIEEDSKHLLGQIEKEITNQEVLLADISSNLKDTASTIEQQMSVLSNARKISNPDTLLTNIQDGDYIIEKARKLLEDIERTRKSYTIGEVLPFCNEIDKMKKSLHALFTMSPLSHVTPASTTKYTSFPLSIGKSVEAKRRSYDSMTKIENLRLRKPGRILFRISESKFHIFKETVTIYDVHKPYIIVFDMNKKQMTNFTCTRNILRMASLSADMHVMVEFVTERRVHILDQTFKIVNTLYRDNGYQAEPFGIYPLSDASFLLSESLGLHRARFKEITLTKSNKFIIHVLCEVNFTDDIGLLSLHGDGKYIAMISQNTIHTVELKTGLSTKLDLKGINMRCIHVDQNDQILIGDIDGKIYQITSNKYEGELQNMKGTGTVGGISLIGDKLVIVAGEYINIYQ